MSKSSTRDSILKEATACFAQQGFAGTSLNDIAAGVGIKRPSLLHYFGSKEEIYTQVLATALTEWAQRVAAATEPGLEGWEPVDAVLEASFKFFAANPEVVRIFRREALSQRCENDLKAPGVVLRPYFGRATAYLEREMDAGRFRRHDPENLLVTGYGALLSYFSDHQLLSELIGGDPLSDDALEQRYSHLRDFFFAALVL